MSLPNVKIEIGETVRSYRYNTRIITVKVENRTGQRLYIDKFEFSLPGGARVLGATSQYLKNRELERVKLLRDLTLLLNDEVFFSLQSVQDKRRKILQSFVEDVLGSTQETVTGVMRKLIRNVTKPWITRALVDQFLERLHATAFVISSSSDAERLMTEVTRASEGNRMLSVVFVEKIGQLKEIENEVLLASDRIRGGVTIESGGDHEERIIIEFDQGLMNIRPYNIQVTVWGGCSRGDRGNVSGDCTIQVLPRRGLLALTASMMGVIGSVIRLQGEVSVLEILAGGVVGGVVFASYEYIFDKLKRIPPEWPMALILGSVSGLCTKEVIEYIRSILQP